MPEKVWADCALRALLTETLPYEVPVIFSNDRWFKMATSPRKDGVKGDAETKLLTAAYRYTVPYDYVISKNDGSTKLSVIHPQTQLSIARFYDLHGRTMVANCCRSEFTLRAPIGVATPHKEEETAPNGDPAKTGIVEQVTDPGLLDKALDDSPSSNSVFVSYFAYGKYNLLGKFRESAEFLRLEKKFIFMRSLDVTKCFYNIYTHSITWAVKDKAFAKEHTSTYSFESAFDKLMQRSNYNETNGIVVGPEISRVFAEIILQDVDRKVHNTLAEKGLHINRDYSVRRYVDDYFILANTEDMLDKVDKLIRQQLSFYKLYVNETKVVTARRPFVSDISLARREIGNVLTSLHEAMAPTGETTAVLAGSVSRGSQSRAIRRQIKELRLIVGRFGVNLSTLSGWLLSSFKTLVRSAAQAVNEAPEETVGSAVEIMSALLDVIFYVVALDTRVRPIYSLCQVLSVVGKANLAGTADRGDRINHLISEELQLIIGSMITLDGQDTEGDKIELFNCLICGAQYLGKDFIQQKTIIEAIRRIARAEKITYFSYITVKFTLLKDSHSFDQDLRNLNARVKQRLIENSGRISIESELFMLACDYVSATDVGLQDKAEVLQFIAPGRLSNADVSDIADRIGFVDWNGLQIDHLLERRELRPVYTWV